MNHIPNPAKAAYLENQAFNIAFNYKNPDPSDLSHMDGEVYNGAIIIRSALLMGAKKDDLLYEVKKQEGELDGIRYHVLEQIVGLGILEFEDPHKKN